MEVFVPEYDWNCQWESVEASVSAGQDFVAAWNTRASQAPKGRDSILGEQK